MTTTMGCAAAFPQEFFRGISSFQAMVREEVPPSCSRFRTYREVNLPGNGDIRVRGLAILSQHTQHAALDRHLGGRHVDGFHFHIGGLQADYAAF